MAMFRLQITSIKRSENRQATGAAAYRAGEKIRDERTGELHNHTRRRDVTHKEIIVPTRFAGESLEWARDRSRLWNAAEKAEARRDARVAREFQVTLPSELAAPRRETLARAFSQELADRYNIVVDLAIHDPRPGSDPRNFHAHILTTTREVAANGLGGKAGLDMHSVERQRLELPSIPKEFVTLRERWATLTNEALQEAHIDARVDHRSLAAQGIDREPKPHIPTVAFKIEKSGQRSEVAERLRAEYNSRVQARAQRAAGREELAAAAPASEPPRSAQPVPRRSLEDVRRQARENWLRIRAAQNSAPSEQARESPIHEAAAHDRSAAVVASKAPAPAGSTPTRQTADAGQHAARRPDDDHSR
jgi:ATP-dependent exoDNAse (exonuclease V) alpha subunit